MTTTKWNYLRLLGAMACIGMAALSHYLDRGEPTWGFIGAAAFVCAVALNLEDDDR